MSGSLFDRGTVMDSPPRAAVNIHPERWEPFPSPRAGRYSREKVTGAESGKKPRFRFDR